MVASTAELAQWREQMMRAVPATPPATPIRHRSATGPPPVRHRSATGPPPGSGLDRGRRPGGSSGSPQTASSLRILMRRLARALERA
jgi:hypothetical protein